MSRSGNDNKSPYRSSYDSERTARMISNGIGGSIISEIMAKKNKREPQSGIKREFWLVFESLILKGVKLENAIVLAKREIKYKPEFKSIFDKYDFDDFLREWYAKGRDVEVLKKLKQQEEGKDDNEKS